MTVLAKPAPAAVLLLLVVLVAMLSGCVSEAETTGATVAASTLQPFHGRYDCGENGTISVEANGSFVRLVEEDDGDFYDLPASPPSQGSRFGEGGYALVVEDREALWMKGNSAPVSCQR